MTKSRKKEELDVLIIGGGPAGLSAFLWCEELGLSTLLIEKNSEFGGQLLWIHNPIKNYLGRSASNGREMLDHFLSQVKDIENHAILNCSVVEFDPQTVAATLSNGEVVQARAAIIATGVRRRQLGVPGEREFSGRGILDSGAKDKKLVTGKRVAIIGGGDAAFENALLMADFAEKVYLIHRRSKFSARPEFVEPAQNNPKIEFVLDSTVIQFTGDKRLTSVSVKNDIGIRQIEIDAALVRVGVQPNTEFLKGKIDLDQLGYIHVDPFGVTGIPHVSAVGDVANPKAPTISTAVGDAATAAKSIHHLLYFKSRL